MKLEKILALAFISSTVAFSSCSDIKFGNSFLEKPLTTDITEDDIFESAEYADQVLTTAYSSLYDFLPQDSRLAWCMLESITDLGDVYKSGGTYYHEGNISASGADEYAYAFTPYTSNIVGSFATAIRYAWTYIENVDKVPDMTDEEKKIRKAEAKLLIAFNYVQAFRYMGGMPWIDHAYTPDEDVELPRLTVEATVAKIVALIDEACKDAVWSVDAADDGRFTAAAGYAMKSRLLTFAASPLLNNDEPYLDGEASTQLISWYGNYSDQRWQDAIDAGLEFIDNNEANGGFYALVTGGDEPRDDYADGYFNRYNGEVLVSSRRWITYNLNNKSFAQIRFGVCVPTNNIHEAFEFADGTKFSWDKIGGTTSSDRISALDIPEYITGGDPFFNEDGSYKRDARLYETMGVNGDRYNGSTLECYIGGDHSPDPSEADWKWSSNARCGAGNRKFRRDWGSEVSNMFYSCPLLRLPEVYLNIAEAMNELGQTTTPDKYGRDAYDYINIVRNRAGMPDVDETIYTSGEKLRDYILEERIREFAFEEVRYFDLCRWKRKDLWRNPIYRFWTYLQADGTYNYDLIYNSTSPYGQYDNARLWLEDNNFERFYLLPWPVDEVNKNYGLIQNPGW